MAPKCLPTKRPAANVRRTAKAAPTVAKPNPKPKARALQTIIARLQGTGEVPSSLQLLISRLARGLAANGRRHIGLEAGASILGKAVRGVQRALEAQQREARAAVDGAAAEKEARMAAQAAAESELASLRRALDDKRAALAESAKAIDEQRAAVQAARAAQRSAEGLVKGSEHRKRQLEDVERDTFEPLKDSPASGSNGQKRLLTLRKFGRDHGFHKELLTVLPAVLRKQPDKRRTFDGLCLQQLEVEFARQAGSLDCSLRESELQAAQRAEELEQAQQAMQEARVRRREGARELAAAEAALEAGKKAVVEARRHVKRLPADLKLAARRLAQAEGRVEKFRRGPLAAYQKTMPPEEVQVRGSPEEIEEPVHDVHPTEEELEDEDEQLEF